MRDAGAEKADAFPPEAPEKLQALGSQDAAQVIPDVSPDIRYRQHLLRMDVPVIQAKNDMVHVTHHNRPKAHNTRFDSSIKYDSVMDVVMDMLFGLQESIQLGVSNFAVTLLMARPAASDDYSIVDDDRANWGFACQSGLLSLSQGFSHEVLVVEGVEIHVSFFRIQSASIP